MPTKYIAIGAAVIILAGGAYAFLTYGKPAAVNQNGTPTNTANNSQTGEGAFTGSLAELMGRTGSWKCTFGTEGAGYSSSGTTYVSGGKIRADFTSYISQIKQTIDNHMIQDGGFVYVWTSLAPQGFKAKTTLGTSEATAQFSAQGVNIDQKYNYNCTPWTVDVSLFALPKDVTFVGQ
jgi:hypothetical protein